MKALLVFRWLLATLVVVNSGSRGEDLRQLNSRHRSKETRRQPEDLPRIMEFDTGSEAKISCHLKRPKSQRIWHWIPQYPTCAGMKGGLGENAIRIFSSGTGNEKLVYLDRFKQRLTEEKETNNTVSFLIIQTAYMNDSGTYFCSNDRKNSSRVLVTVKPGYQNGITTGQDKELHQHGQTVKLSCNNCEEQNDKHAPGGGIITWTLNGNPLRDVPNIRTLRNTIIIDSFSSRHYGLWNCSQSTCPGKFEGYCLESDLSRKETTFLQGDGKETTSSSAPTSSPQNAGNPIDARLIGACVAVFLGFLLVAAVIFFICRRHRSHSVSETTRESDLQDSKNPMGPPMKRDEGEPMPDVREPEEAEGIQYSTLTFRDPGGHQIKIENETSAVIYSNITAARS